MEQIKIPDGYQSSLNLHDTQIAIKTVKDFFQQTLAQKLNLLRVSAPVFVNPSSGLNDNLNGVERPVSFDIKGQPENAEIVHSLAKWKRYALQKYGFAHGEGLYTDMIAIRRDEDLDNIHSVYVDQWDWEKIISKEERNMDTLVSTVRAIYSVLRKTEKYMAVQYDYIEEILPREIAFVSTQELVDMYPDLTPKEREYKIVKEKGYGFTAIIVAFLGRLHPIGIVLAGLLMALTYIGGDIAQLMLQMPAATVQVFQGMLLFYLLGFDLLTRYRIRRRVTA